MADRRGAQLRQSAALVMAGILLGGSRSLVAQTTGRIEGLIRDGAKGALPGITVEASSSSLQGIRAATTDAEGRFRFPALPPGIYTIRATASGFRSSEKLATVSLDSTVTADLTLEPAAEEQVLVSGEAPRIDLGSTTTGTNYTSRVVTNLPVARNYADIVKSNPGVSTDRGATEGRSLALAIYGATSAENQWIIDGVNTTNVLRGVQAGSSTSSRSPEATRFAAMASSITTRPVRRRQRSSNPGIQASIRCASSAATDSTTDSTWVG